MKNQPIIPSNNEDWGFSTIRSHACFARAWPLALTKIKAATGGSAIGVRDFLDSRDGRHFADHVTCLMEDSLALAEAIDKTIKVWMTWRIHRNVHLDYGIPQGLPYLAGFVGHYDILSECVA
jgi:hypothetical protein